MDLSNQKQAETIVGAEMIELSLEHLASVSGGVTQTSTTVISGQNCTYKEHTDRQGNSTVTVTCQSPPVISRN
jgi:hypothetical protein